MKRVAKSSLATLVLVASVGATSAMSGVPVASAASNTITLVQYEPYTDQFIPLVASDLYTNDIYAYAFDTLLAINGKFQYEPDIVKSYSWSKDHMSVTMHIDPKAVWSDGQPITSADVLLAMDFLASKVYNTTQQGQYGYLVQNVKGFNDVVAGKKTSFAQTGGFTTINDKTFEIHMSTLDAAVLYSSLAGIYPLPSHILGKIPFSKWPTSAFDKSPTVVSGPYEFQHIQGTSSVEMTANPKYFRGVPKIQNVVWQTVSTDVAPGLLASGKLDFMVQGFKFGDIAKLKQVPGITVATPTAQQFYYLGLRMNNYPEFDNVKVRQAFEYGMDRQGMLNGILKGYGQVLNGPLPSVTWAAAPASDLNPYPYNLTKANQLLNQAGWKIGKDGWRIDPRTHKTANLELQPPVDPGVRQPIAEAIAQEFQKLHIKVTVSPAMDIQTFYNNLQNPKYKPIQMYVAAWTLGSDPDPRGLWDSTDAFNYEHWVDKANDQLIGATWNTAAAFTTAGRKAAFVKWQEYVNKEMPLNFLFSFDNVYAYDSHVQIPANDITPAGLLNPQDWSMN